MTLRDADVIEILQDLNGEIAADAGRTIEVCCRKRGVRAFRGEMFRDPFEFAAEAVQGDCPLFRRLINPQLDFAADARNPFRPPAWMLGREVARPAHGCEVPRQR